MLSRQKKVQEGSGDQKVRAKRIDVKRSVMVESRTIGAPMVFSLATENLSRTGLLLAGANGYKIPYQLNTLVEMSIDTTGQLLHNPIACLGKVVRIIGRDQKRDYFGVQIVHMDSKEQISWEKAVAQLEAAEARLLPA